MPKVERRLPLKQVIKVMRTAFETCFHCEIELYSEKSPSIAVLNFDGFSIHIYETKDEEKFEFLTNFYEVGSKNLREAALTLPRAVELLSILQLM